MTERLYYDDSYLKSFTATVLESEKRGTEYIVTLDRSAFYPTSGGQPFDTGALGGANITNVFVDGDEVRHALDAPLEVGKTVTGVIDWKRRFDHMQQHAGEHMIAGAIYKILKGNTIGLHLGEDFSTIDVELPDGAMRVEQTALDEIELTVNEWIQRDLPIKCFFPTAEELKAEPLRKPPTVSEHVRLVKIGDVECVACGGTHPNTTGQVAVVKIIDVRPSRGKMRVAFVCGMRAFLDYRAKFESSCRAARLLSTSAESLPGALEKTLGRLREAERELNDIKNEAARQKLKDLMANAAALPNGLKAVAGVLDGIDQNALGEAAKLITKQSGLCAILANGRGEGASLVFAAGEGCGVDMGKVFAASVKPLGGKGGGRGDLARGAGPGDECVRAAIRELGAWPL